LKDVPELEALSTKPKHTNTCYQAPENMLPSTWRPAWLERWRSWSSGGAKALEELDLWRSWNYGEARISEEPELCRK